MKKICLLISVIGISILVDYSFGCGKCETRGTNNTTYFCSSWFSKWCPTYKDYKYEICDKSKSGGCTGVETDESLAASEEWNYFYQSSTGATGYVCKVNGSWGLYPEPPTGGIDCQFVNDKKCMCVGDESCHKINYGRQICTY